MARPSYNANGVNGIDTREVSTLNADLRDAPFIVQARAQRTLKRGAVNVKREARETIAGIRSSKTRIPKYPYTIDFDLAADGLQADIGPNKSDDGQAALGNLLEYGSMFNAPFPHLQPSLEHEAPRFLAALAADASEIL